MPEKKPWKSARLDAKGKPAANPSGPCPNCPPVDIRNVEMLDWARKNASSGVEFAKVIALLGSPTVCGVCGGAGFIKVCESCDGHGITEKVLIKDTVLEPYEGEEEYEIEPAIYNLLPVHLRDNPEAVANQVPVRPAVMGTRKVTLFREVERDAWLNGDTCADCKGSGQVPVLASEVSK